MKRFENQTYIGERAKFMSKDTEFFNCIFKDGESPLKESSDLSLQKCTFEWKYPLWYCSNVKVLDSLLKENARSGIWYTKNIEIINSRIEAPKTFRRSEGITLLNVDIPNGKETFWKCKNVNITKVKAKGDYFGFNSEDVEVTDLYLEGNYCFDGGKNIVIRNSTLYSKDSFWNSENVTIINSTIIGEYLGWNSKNLKLINCKIISHQGLCYIDGLTLVNCTLEKSDMTFEFCKNIDAEIISEVDSILNPISGVIRVKAVKKLIMDEKVINPNDTKIVVGYEK